MQSELLIAIAGLATTVIAAAVGTAGTIVAAQLTGRTQSDGQIIQARQNAFQACTTEFIARQVALGEFNSLLFRVSVPPALGVEPDLRYNREEFSRQHEELKRLSINSLQALGSIAIVGTPIIWFRAQLAYETAEIAYERMLAWFKFLRDDGRWTAGPITRTESEEFRRLLAEHTDFLYLFLDACNAAQFPRARGRSRSARHGQLRISEAHWTIATERD